MVFLYHVVPLKSAGVTPGHHYSVIAAIMLVVLSSAVIEIMT